MYLRAECVPFCDQLKKDPASIAFYQVHWEINSVMGKKWETFHREEEKIASFA